MTSFLKRDLVMACCATPALEKQKKQEEMLLPILSLIPFIKFRAKTESFPLKFISSELQYDRPSLNSFLILIVYNRVGYFCIAVVFTSTFRYLVLVKIG